MKKLTSDQIRSMWLEFFKSKNHFILSSASLIPVDDPSLLWINSGVATLKPFFEGIKKPPSKRLVNIQKAIRTNDIENVGITARHHTLFEMMGNFSIGDYFKKEALSFAWEFLTDPKWLGLPINKLYFTIFKDDSDTYDIVKNNLKIKEDHIIKGGKDTNFWEIGQGPCGPNAEIFYDRGLKFDPKKQGINLLKKDLENDRYIEIWNIVFSEFNNDGFGNYSKLPQKNIDTGAGLERIVSIIQDTYSNFETDLFLPIINKVIELSKNTIKYNFENYDDLNNVALKIISDHTKAVCFAIADGIFPSNKDQGYVIRKLIRRAIFYAKKINFSKPVLYKLVPTICKILDKFYPYLTEQKELLVDTIRKEEQSYWKILEESILAIDDFIAKNKNITGKDALILFESFGCPIDLIVEHAKTRNTKVDIKGFEKLLAQAKDLSRNTRKKTQGLKIQKDVFLKLDAYSEFIGYTKNKISNAKVIAIVNDDLEKVGLLKNEIGFIILDKTPFYATSGGQNHDFGIIKGQKFEGEILDVTKGPNNEHIHKILIKGIIESNDIVNAEIDTIKRKLGMKNHSATHLLHSATREILGKNTKQIGSYNDFEKLRLDISVNSNLDDKVIKQIEQLVNTKIQESIDSEIIYCDHKTAVEKYNALAFFGEKYLEEVRVVKFGSFSCELCGGTHCKNTKEIEKILITNYESKGSGSYRIYALTTNKTIDKYLTNEINKKIAQHCPKIENFLKENKKILNNKKLIELLTDIKKCNSLDVLDNKLQIINSEFVSYQKQVTDVLTNNYIKKIKLQKLNNNNSLVIELLAKTDLSLNISKIMSAISDVLINNNENIFIALLFSKSPHKFNFLLSTNDQDININKFIKKNLVNHQDFTFKGGGNNKFGQGLISTMLGDKKLLTTLTQIIKEGNDGR